VSLSRDDLVLIAATLDSTARGLRRWANRGGCLQLEEGERERVNRDAGTLEATLARVEAEMGP
jgi:hypothetical protein